MADSTPFVKSGMTCGCNLCQTDFSVRSQMQHIVTRSQTSMSIDSRLRIKRTYRTLGTVELSDAEDRVKDHAGHEADHNSLKVTVTLK